MFVVNKITLLVDCLVNYACYAWSLSPVYIKVLVLFLMTQSKYSSEGLSEFWVEDCVNYRIDTRIDISQEGCGLEGKVAGRCVQVIFYA